ncbi:hypothetical protein A2V71_00315 [Candidatus Berkelbacteria bacterium RBG_13_40_8]|uniref:HNH nuclease domain-containing protein n=1 Tax=Candidatus Berkelbacteria bacterium RBG_13_40_8 TaxID=1797467 RepID=A0A1F5DPJ4_9BACT|nr:MAG: hypothetical protein A2V71_00315 [Candidatus Berkelbacteria bacterium RBG_13_40_8]
MNKFGISLKDEKIKRLLWCDRHCCLCRKSCGIDIEFAHLPGKEKSKDINDMVPVCSECHTKIGCYNPSHKKGTKYNIEELKARREQIYDTYTRELVPPIYYEITQNITQEIKRIWPDVGFSITHIGDLFPVKALIVAKIFLRNKFLRNCDKDGYYDGKKFWNLNPRMGYNGHFSIMEPVDKEDRLEIKVYVTIVDQYERSHELLPVSWVYRQEDNCWFTNP